MTINGPAFCFNSNKKRKIQTKENEKVNFHIGKNKNENVIVFFLKKKQKNLKKKKDDQNNEIYILKQTNTFEK